MLLGCLVCVWVGPASADKAPGPAAKKLPAADPTLRDLAWAQTVGVYYRHLPMYRRDAAGSPGAN